MTARVRVQPSSPLVRIAASVLAHVDRDLAEIEERADREIRARGNRAEIEAWEGICARYQMGHG